MSIASSARVLLLVFLPGLFAAHAQQPAPPAPPVRPVQPAPRSILLNVVVAPKSGPAVANLQQQDFTVLDNKTERPITSFKAVTAGQEPVEVILLLDAVNTGFRMVAYIREGVEKFLQANGGKLSAPTAVAVLTDKGLQAQPNFTTDGNALSNFVQNDSVALREVTRAAGYWGANERFGISMNGFRQLAGAASRLPGRKIVLWISPGWPLLSGVRTYLDSRQEDQIFHDIVFFSSQLRQDNVTVYNINPLGVGEPLLRADYYQAFLAGVAKPSQTQIGDLGLQVISVQSGGLALESNSDVTGMLNQCMEDTKSWYEITFDAAPAERPDQYHHIEIRVDKPGLIARTRTGYYAQP